MRNQRRVQGSLADQAYTRIRERILKGEFSLGAAVSRRKLASEFGMSFLPVSEAIKRLEDDGLLESEPRVGTRVRVPSAQDFRDRYVMREALEAQAARLFAERASPEERLELRAMAAHLDTLTDGSAGNEKDSESRFHAQMYHLSFHMRIAKCSGCAALCEALEKNQALIFNWLYDIAAEHQMPPGWHQQLMTAVSGTDPEIADEAMRRHVRHGREEIHAAIVGHFGVNPPPLVGKRKPGSPDRSKRGSWRVKAANSTAASRS